MKLKTRFEYLQHDTHWPRLAGQTTDMPAEWHTLEFGRNGWELVTVVRTPTGTLTAFFKREVEMPNDGGEGEKLEAKATPAGARKKGKL